MASTYSNLKFELIGTGEQAGVWGTTTNTNIGTAIEEAITGSADVTFSSADVTLTLSNTNSSQVARNLRLNLVGTSGGARNLILGAGCQINKFYIIQNNLAHAVTVKNTTGSGVAVGAGRAQLVFNNGTDVVLAASGDIVGPASSVNNGLVLFDGTTGKVLKSSASSDGNINGLTVGRGKNNSSSSTAFGSGALGSSTAGLGLNTAIGSSACVSVTSGGENTAVGGSTLVNLTTGSYNTAVGAQALVSTTGSFNTAVGLSAASGVTSGTSNTAIGAGSSCGTTGSNNTAIGASAGGSSSPFNIGTSSNRIVLGNNSVTDAYVRVAWTVTSDARDKADVNALGFGLNLIEKLNPVTFRWDMRSNYYVFNEEGEVVDKPLPDGSKKEPKLFSGFIAQQVQQAIEDVGYPDDVIIDTEDPDNLKLKETALIPILVNAIKELKSELSLIKAELAALKS